MKKFFVIASILASFCAQAASEQIPKDRKITELSVYENDAVIRFTPAYQNSQNCPETGTTQVVIDLANEKGKSMLSTALAAASAGKTVGFGINGCKNSPEVYRIDVLF